MKMTISLDNSKLKSIKAKVTKLHNTHNEWGWINEKTYPSGDVARRDHIKIAEIARINEYGGLSKARLALKPTLIPPRPYFRQALLSTQLKSRKMMMEIAKAALEDRDFYSLMEKAANQAAVDLITSIKKQNMKPLAKKTVTIKGHGIQWLDTGVLLSNITYKVYRKNIDKAKGVER